VKWKIPSACTASPAFISQKRATATRKGLLKNTWKKSSNIGDYLHAPFSADIAHSKSFNIHYRKKK